jgi:molecular chaperone DnaJ
VSLTEEQKAILHKLDESIRTGGDKHNPRAEGWLETVKRFFEKISP